MTASTNGYSSVRIGHWTNANATSGCTVILFDSLTPATIDVRGGAPGTRETDLLASGRSVRAVDAIVLTGGSAFGLSTADGVMTYLREHGRGYLTSAGPVPIVASAVIFDLDLESIELPDSKSGYFACQHAFALPFEYSGRIGGGTGATIRKLWGQELTRPSGLGISTVQTAYGSVTSVLVLNAVGASLDDAASDAFSRETLYTGEFSLSEREATTIGVIIIDLVSDHSLLERCAISAHDGLARSICPAHTVFDGDLFFAAGLRAGVPEPGAILAAPTAAEAAVERAIQAIFAL